MPRLCLELWRPRRRQNRAAAGTLGQPSTVLRRPFFFAQVASQVFPSMNPYWWPAIVFGAPGLIGSLVVSGFGVHLGKPIFLRIGAILALPSAYYIGGIPGWWPAFILLPALHLIVSDRCSSLAAVAGGVPASPERCGSRRIHGGYFDKSEPGSLAATL